MSRQFGKARASGGKESPHPPHAWGHEGRCWLVGSYSAVTATEAEERFIEELKQRPEGTCPREPEVENARLRDALQQAVIVDQPAELGPRPNSPARPRWGRSTEIDVQDSGLCAPVLVRAVPSPCNLLLDTYLLLPGDGGLLGGTTPTPPTSLASQFLTMSLPPPPIQVSKPGPPLSVSLPGPPRKRSLPIPLPARSLRAPTDHIVTRLCGRIGASDQCPDNQAAMNKTLRPSAHRSVHPRSSVKRRPSAHAARAWSRIKPPTPATAKAVARTRTTVSSTSRPNAYAHTTASDLEPWEPIYDCAGLEGSGSRRYPESLGHIGFVRKRNHNEGESQPQDRPGCHR